MSSPSPAPDNSYAVEQLREKQAADQRAQDKADADAAAAKLAALRSSTADAARNQTQDYLRQQGLDPTQYSGDIDSQINRILTTINPSDPNPGSSFLNADQTIYNNLTKNYQSKNQTALNNVFSPNFETTKLPTTIDQPYVDNIYADQRSQADNIIQNMLKRGVLTSTGVVGAEGDLDRQAPGVKTQLQQLADSVIAGGQSKLKDIANTAQTTAGTLKLGQQFDPTSYSKQTDDAFNNFIANLSTSIKAKVPGNLFQTNGLAAIGGAAQGAGNTAYDPTAAAGSIAGTTGKNANDPTNTSTTPTSKESIF